MSATAPVVAVREVLREDIATFATYRADPIGAKMAELPLRTPEETDAQWTQILADPDCVARTITADGAVAGYLNLFGPPKARDVGYWIDRALWGRGIATAALRRFLAEISERPLNAQAAEDNLGSQRVLEKCRFVRVRRQLAEDGIWEIAFALGA